MAGERSTSLGGIGEIPSLQFASVEEAERGCRKLVVQLLSYLGVDVRGEHVSISLIKAIKTPLGRDHTDKPWLRSMEASDAAKIAVKQASSLNSGRIMLNGCRV